MFHYTGMLHTYLKLRVLWWQNCKPCVCSIKTRAKVRHTTYKEMFIQLQLLLTFVQSWILVHGPPTRYISTLINIFLRISLCFVLMLQLLHYDARGESRHMGYIERAISCFLSEVPVHISKQESIYFQLYYWSFNSHFILKLYRK